MRAAPIVGRIAERGAAMRPAMEASRLPIVPRIATWTQAPEITMAAQTPRPPGMPVTSTAATPATRSSGGGILVYVPRPGRSRAITQEFTEFLGLVEVRPLRRLAGPAQLHIPLELRQWLPVHLFPPVCFRLCQGGFRPGFFDWTVRKERDGLSGEQKRFEEDRYGLQTGAAAQRLRSRSIMVIPVEGKRS
jgi:hypothetical protein